jgi:RNA polymerase sigma-70 factor (ECF subfamily)
LARHDAREGDRFDVQAAYAAHARELYQLALRQLGDDGAAQDVVQEVFLRAWRSNGYDPGRGSLRTWLFAITRNVIIDHARRGAVQPFQRALTEDDHDIAYGVNGSSDALVDKWVVEEALRRLDKDHRIAIEQTYLHGRPQADVAAELNIPLGTLRSRVFYGMKALRLTMEEMGVEP